MYKYDPSIFHDLNKQIKDIEKESGKADAVQNYLFQEKLNSLKTQKEEFIKGWNERILVIPNEIDKYNENISYLKSKKVKDIGQINKEKDLVKALENEFNTISPLRFELYDSKPRFSN